MMGTDYQEVGSAEDVSQIDPYYARSMDQQFRQAEMAEQRVGGAAGQMTALGKQAMALDPADAFKMFFSQIAPGLEQYISKYSQLPGMGDAYTRFGEESSRQAIAKTKATLGGGPYGGTYYTGAGEEALMKAALQPLLEARLRMGEAQLGAQTSLAGSLLGTGLQVAPQHWLQTELGGLQAAMSGQRSIMDAYSPMAMAPQVEPMYYTPQYADQNAWIRELFGGLIGGGSEVASALIGAGGTPTGAGT